MGVFHTVTASCPMQTCPGFVEFQSKSVPGCNSYLLETAPAKVLIGIAGDLVRCPKCDTLVQATVKVKATVRTKDKNWSPNKYTGGGKLKW